MRRYVVAASLLCLFVANVAFSQGGNAQIGGVVTDPSGALMPGVTISVTNTETGVVNSAITNESGAYNLPSLLPGSAYRASASLPGFQTKTMTSLVLGLGQTVRQDFTLELAGTATTLEVSVEANQLLNTASQSVGEVLTASRVRDLPIVGNDVLDLITLMPGVRGTPDNPVFAGVDENRINTVRDGLSTSDGRFESGVFSTTFINPDLVGEIRIILAPVDAEMGRGNGQVQISTRSGTNRYTGTAQWDIRNTALNPNTWGNNNDVDPITGAWLPTQPNWSNTHHFSVSYGGPIVRNKTFFFALWDQQLQYQRNTVTATVMTDAARNGVFRYFPQWINGNADAATVFGTPTTATRAVVDFQGNPVVPAENQNGTPYTGQLTCFSIFGTIKADGSPFGPADCPGGNAISGTWDSVRPVMDTTGYIAKVLGKMPKANYFGTGDGLNTAGYRYLRTRRGNSGAAVTIGTDTDTDRKQFNIKIDQNFNANHKISGNWSYERNDTYNDQPNWPDGIPYFTQRYPQIFTLNATSTLSPNILNEARFGIRYSNANIAAPHEENYYPNKDVVQEALTWTQPLAGYNVTFSPGAGNFAFGGTANGIFTTAPGQYNGNVSSLYNYADTVSWTSGKHAFKFGGEWRSTKTVGYNNIPRIPFVRVLGGAAAGQASNLGTAGNTPTLPASSLLGTNRTNAVNMLYFLSGSVSDIQTLYWIDDSTDVTNGTWESVVTKERKFRDVIQNEAGFFVKDDWKISRNLTLNLGVRWDWYGSPFIGSGFTSTVIGQGAGLYGAGRDGTPDLFDNWLQPGSLYLSGYGPNAGTAGLQCTTGTSNGPFLPASSCDPSNLTTIEFIGPNTPNPSKAAYRNDFNNIGPAAGFSWNVPWFGESRSTTVRGGYQLTYGGPGREIGGGGVTSAEVVIGGAPGALNSANTVPGDFTDTYFNLVDVPAMVPVRPSLAPGGTVPIYDGSANFTAVDPNWVTPYTQNFTLSVTTNLTRKMTLDLRYIGTVSKKQQGTTNFNTNNAFFNKELVDALEITRKGGEAPLFDQMLAGLNLNSTGVTGATYGPVGTCVTQPAGFTSPALGQEGCAANQVRQHGSAHLRRNATFQDNIANGNYVAVAGSLTGLASNLPAVGATGGFLFLPDTDPVTTGRQALTGVNDRRLLRNGCDRIAAGLYDPTLPASATNISTRCFPENYFEANPQLGTPTFVTNNAMSNYHSMQAQMTLRPTAGLSWQGTYTWSKNLGYGGDNFNYSDPFCRACDYSLTNQDITHDIRTNGTFELPIGPNKLVMGNSTGWLARMVERWQTSVIFNWNSGTPATITGATMYYGNARPDIVSAFDFDGSVRWDDDVNANGVHGGTYFGNNPNPYMTVPDPQCQVANVTDSMGFNTVANGDCSLTALAHRNADGTPGQIIFQSPLPGKVGTVGRQVMRNIGHWSLDANLSKTFRISETKSVQVRIDTTNVLNHPGFGNPAINPNFNSQSGNFGDITGKNGGRSFQGTMRLTF